MLDQLDLWPDEQKGAPLRWSVSRDRRMAACLRRYYLVHYGSRGGAQAPAGSALREIYILKLLRNRYMWVGEIVHALIEDALRSFRLERPVSANESVRRGVQRMRTRYRESARGSYRQRPERFCGLIEHEYAENIGRIEWQAQRDRMERCLRNFFAMELVKRYGALPRARWLALEKQGSFDVDGATVVVKPDFACQPDRRTVAIVDWKTGQQRPEEDRFQLAVYGLYGRRAWKLGDDEDVQGHAAYLDGGQVVSATFTHEELDATRRRIAASIADMRRLDAIASDPRRTPQEVQAAFPRTADSLACMRCAFRRVCADDGKQERDPPERPEPLGPLEP